MLQPAETEMLVPTGSEGVKSDSACTEQASLPSLLSPSLLPPPSLLSSIHFHSVFSGGLCHLQAQCLVYDLQYTHTTKFRNTVAPPRFNIGYIVDTHGFPRLLPPAL